MKELKLSRTDKVALVDDEDFEYITKLGYRWSISNGYAFTSNKQTTTKPPKFPFKIKNVSLHRIIFDNYKNMDYLVDHIDGNRLNNQKSNLRYVTVQGNLLNRHSVARNNKSGYLGVSYDKSRNKWKAHLKLNRVLKNIGRYDTKEDAIKARQEYFNKVVPQLYDINFPMELQK